MSFRANVLKVMIASPGDVGEERRIVTEQIYKWNDANASARNLVLLPIKWETHSTPQMGSSPQTIINRQILDDADIVIGIFGTRIGTPTETHISGTVEEIKEHVAAGKTAKVYFSDVPIPPSELNAEQYESVKKFRQECQSMGLYATFHSIDDFRRDFSQHLAIELNQGRYKWLASPDQSKERQDIEITADELSLLKAASADDGVIICDDDLGMYGVRAGNTEFSDGTARTHARWRDMIQRFQEKGILEHISGALYRMTELGYRITERTEVPEAAAKNAFLSIQEQHTRTVVDALNWIERDFIRFLLLKGGSTRNDAISPALSNPSGGVDFNGMSRPLIQGGLMESTHFPMDGHSEYSIKSELKDLLQRILFPRQEERPPFFKGIPV